MRALLISRQATVANLQHVKIVEATGSGIGGKSLRRGGDADDRTPGIRDVAGDAPGVAGYTSPCPDAVCTPVTHCVVDVATRCLEGITHGCVAGLGVS